MTDRLQRLVTLAAVLAPAECTALLEGLAAPSSDAALRQSAALASSTRRARLAALAGVAAGPCPGSRTAVPPLLERLRRDQTGAA